MAKKARKPSDRRTVGGYPSGPRTPEEIGPPPQAFLKSMWITQEEFDATRKAAEDQKNDTNHGAA